MTVLRLGTAKVDITPHHPIPLAGFAHRKGNFERIDHPLHMRLLFFEQEEGGRCLRQFLWVSADLIWWGSDRLPHIRQRLKEEFGLEPEGVILQATHNHSGPQTSDLFTPSLGRSEAEYLEFLEAALLQGVREAKRTMEPVTLERGQGECHIGVHRRKWVNGEIVMAPNPQEAVDPEVNVIRFLPAGGIPKAVMVHFACHASTTGDNALSSEFPGLAMDYIESQSGSDPLTAIYLQGFCGDVRPALVRDDAFYRGHDEEVRRFARDLADAVFNVLKAPMQPVPPSLITFETLSVDLLFQSLPTQSELKHNLADEGIHAEWAQLLLTHPNRLTHSIPLKMTRVDLGANLSLLTANAEMVGAYSTYLKSSFHGRVLPVGYSNGMIGYVPTARQISEGGYESKESGLYFGLPASFDPSIEETIYSSFRNILERKD